MAEMAQARICWLPEKEGGRKTIPLGPRYVMVARFEQEKDKWPEEAWSLAIENSVPTGDLRSQQCVMANVHFLAPEAPTQLLYKGSRFELFEGRRCVATGEILQEQRKAHESLTA